MDMSVITDIPKEGIFSIFVVIGMIGHYAKKRARNETSISLKDWFGSSNIFGTISSVITAIMTIIGAISQNMITDSMSISAVMYIGLTTGFAVDSFTNGDETSTLPLEHIVRDISRDRRNDDRRESNRST